MCRRGRTEPAARRAYDLFGNGRTALKVSLGRYVAKNSAAPSPDANNPLTTSVNQVNRTWNDTNGNYIPDCDLTNRAAERRVRATGEPELRGPAVATTRYADEVLHGCGAASTTGI